VQTGGPSGGCHSAGLFDTPGRITRRCRTGLDHGSGGNGGDGRKTTAWWMWSRYFVEFSIRNLRKCVPCRAAWTRRSTYLNKFTAAKPAKRISRRWTQAEAAMIRDMSLLRSGPDRAQSGARRRCGTSAANSKTTCGQALPRGVCEELALSPCENSCPLQHEHRASSSC